MLASRRTKIVSTIGPATESKANLQKAIISGMNVARLNFSHGTQEQHLAVITNIRELSKELGAPVAILQDLQGPKIRVGKLEGGAVTLVEGAEVRISTSIAVGNQQVLSTDFKELPHVVKVGTRILMDDGLIELKVLSVSGDEVTAKVIYGGILKNRKGINLPGVPLPIDCMTEKDLEDLAFGLQQKVDYVALSFVRRGEDILRLRKIIQEKAPETRVIAKIEMIEALDNIVEIIELSDAIMVARGDLAVEVGAAQLPLAQKRIIGLCNEMGRPVITATQMLDSMVASPSPTRAEITDVANAVLDGSDALMLSAETASGAYPFKCIQTMHEIITEVEKTGRQYYDISLTSEFMETAEAIAGSASLCALKLDAPVIVCLTTTGKTATQISNFRPRAQIIACTYKSDTLNRLELVWGIQTLRIEPFTTSEEAMAQIEPLLLRFGLAKPNDKVIMTLGLPIAQGAKTNALRVYVVGQKELNGREIEVPLRYRS